ncbi:MAG: YmdB family metallophosphoesterase, partial [Armatimonadota bacterium]|nr:YmdB family metallophosphoesterase [Armatimonadota bacterium]
FMDPLDEPFRMADTILESFQGQTGVSFFDFHAEATSEKNAFGRYLDGRAGVVVGTHTHVQTADERILPRGTAYITDVGMVGPQDSILGMNAHESIQRFITQVPHRFEVAAGPVVLCGIIADVDAETGRASHIERIQIRDIH